MAGRKRGGGRAGGRRTPGQGGSGRQPSPPWWKSREFIFIVLGSLIGGVISLGATVGQSYISRELRLNEPLPTDPPTGRALRVTKVTHGVVEGQNWVLAGPLDLTGLAELNNRHRQSRGSTDYMGYMREYGALGAGEAHIEIEVEGNSRRPVRITGITALAECREPLSGTLFIDKNQGGDAVLPMGFDLDQDRPVARRIEEGSDGGTRFGDPYFQTRKVTLNQGEQETFSMSVKTDTKFCDFQFRLDLIVDGKPTFQLIDNGGKPFQLTADHDWRNKHCLRYQNIYYGWPFAADSGSVLNRGHHWIEEKDVSGLEKPLKRCR